MKIRFDFWIAGTIRYLLSGKKCVNEKRNKCYGGAVNVYEDGTVYFEDDVTGSPSAIHGRIVFSVTPKNSKTPNEFWQKYKDDCFHWEEVRREVRRDVCIFMEEYFDDFSEAILTSEISSVIEYYSRYNPSWTVKGKKYTHLLIQGNGFRMNQVVFDTIIQRHVGHSRIFGDFDPSKPSTEIILDCSDFAGRKIDAELFLWENGISLPEPAAGEG